MKILGVQNGCSGLECVSGNVDGGHSAANNVVALEYPNVEIGGGVVRWSILPEEVGDGGAADAAAYNTYSGRRWLGSRRRNDEEEEEQSEDR